MTDQRPLDPSTLRDGDVVRAKRGEHGVVEGVFCRTGRGGWCLHDGPTSARETAWSADCWTITSIIRPVLVKGDRVEWTNVVTPKQGTYVGPREGGRPGRSQQSIVTNADGRDVVVETCLLTRLPAAPEPAPITVGSWWLSKHDRDEHVVMWVDGDHLGLRWWRSSDVYTVNKSTISDWTPLDGPPAPPVGSVYVIGGVVRQSTERGWHRSFNGSAHHWDEICAALDKDRLATLRILGSVD